MRQQRSNSSSSNASSSSPGRKLTQTQQQASFPSPPMSPGQPQMMRQQQQPSSFPHQQQQQQQQQMMGGPPQGGLGNLQAGGPELALSIQEFFFHFVVPQYGPPPSDISPMDVKNVCISFIASARLSPRDVRISEDNAGGSVWLSNRGLRVLENFMEMKRVGNAAITIQRMYRGFRARKRVALMREGEVNFGEVEEVPDDGSAAPIAQVSSRGSIIVDEVELKRMSVGSSYVGSKRSSFVANHHPSQQFFQQPQQQPSSEMDGAYVPVEEGGYHVMRTYSNGSQSRPPSDPQQSSNSKRSSSGDPEKDRERADRRRSKVMAFKRHLMTISQAYQDIVLANDPSNPPPAGGPTSSPSDREIQFMKLLNSDETFRLSTNLRALHKIERPVTLEEAQRFYEEQGGIPGGRTPAQMYLEYSSRVVEWMNQVIPHVTMNPSSDLVQLLRSGDLLCELAVAIYPRVQCQLLQKGPEFTVHKIIFFLELCKTIGIKPSMLFSMQDLLLGGVEHDPVRKSALTVLRTVCALERQARRRGWNGPAMVLKPEGSEGKRRSSRGSTYAPQADGILSPEGSNPSQDPRNSRRLSQNRRSRTPTRNSSTSPGRSITSKTSSSSMTGSTGNKRLSRRISASLNAVNNATPVSDQAEDLSSLPTHPDRLNRISAMTSHTARESLYSYYVAGNSAAAPTVADDLDAVAKREYEELLAAVKEKERIETEEAERIRAEKEMEEEEKRRVRAREAETVRAFGEGMRRRRRKVAEFLASEETFVHNMTAISDFLSQLLYRRRRESKRHSRGLPPLDAPDVDTPPSTPVEGETPIKTALRIESETESLSLLDRVVADIVILHTELVEDLRTCLADEEVAKVGEVALRFAGDVSGGYASYAVVTRVPAEDSLLDGGAAAAAAGELPAEIFGRAQDGGEFMVKVVQRFIGETFPSSSDGMLTPEEWKWYLSRPLKRLAEYPAVLEGLADEWRKPGANDFADVGGALSQDRVQGSEIEKGLRRCERDDRRLRVAAVKISCVGRAVGKHVGGDL
ncbi:hypothetical protein HDU67_008392 [Dinochytrium kinnereticum]|nr:hypothetical protein HDU67_008392 [Dinochytrium kinnereticum]